MVRLLCTSTATIYLSFADYQSRPRELLVDCYYSFEGFPIDCYGIRADSALVYYNPRRACARVYCVCLSVYPSVPALAASASVETSKQRYSRVSLRLFLDIYMWSFEKTFRSKVMAWKSQLQMSHRQPLSRSFGTNETQQLREGQLVGRMMLQRLATGATGKRDTGAWAEIGRGGFRRLLRMRIKQTTTSGPRTADARVRAPPRGVWGHAPP